MSHLLLIFFPETPHALFLHSRKERGSIFLGSVQRAVLPNTPYYRVGGATATHASVTITVGAITVGATSMAQALGVSKVA